MTDAIDSLQRDRIGGRVGRSRTARCTKYR
jgi:hypothetical protein